MPSAITLGSVGFNIARAIGPALGGFVVSLVGPGFTFLLNAISFCGVVVVLKRWHRVPQESTLPAERLIGAMRTGLRYVVRPECRQFSSTSHFSVFTVASGLFSQLLREHLQLILWVGCFSVSLGRGACGSLFLPRIKSRFSSKYCEGATYAGIAECGLATVELYNSFGCNDCRGHSLADPYLFFSIAARR
jgi:MFS family permease